MATPQDTVIDRRIAYQAIKENFINLTTTSIEPIWLAHHLFASDVITLHQMKETTDGCLPNTVKLSKLLTLVLEGVQRNGHVYTSLLNILSKEGDVYRWLIEGIKNSYDRLYINSLTQSTDLHTGTRQHIEYTVPDPVEYNMASSLSTGSSIFNQKSTSFQNTGIYIHECMLYSVCSYINDMH